MAANQKLPDAENQEQILRDLRQNATVRQAGYRDRALKLLPHICGSCKREFEGRRLRELTVHHKDHNFKNNPPDGSNWELLCLYCHDNEHQRQLEAAGASGTAHSGADMTAAATHSPFANLKSLRGKG